MSLPSASFGPALLVADANAFDAEVELVAELVESGFVMALIICTFVRMFVVVWTGAGT